MKKNDFFNQYFKSITKDTVYQALSDFLPVFPKIDSFAWQSQGTFFLSHCHEFCRGLSDPQSVRRRSVPPLLHWDSVFFRYVKRWLFSRIWGFGLIFPFSFWTVAFDKWWDNLGFQVWTLLIHRDEWKIRCHVVHKHRWEKSVAGCQANFWRELNFRDRGCSASSFFLNLGFQSTSKLKN